MNNSSQPIRWWLPIVAIAAAWLLALLSGCASSAVPLTPRPDTRRIVQVSIDTAALSKALTLFRVSSPNEASICWRGEVKPFMLDSLELLQIDVQDFYIAATDSVDEFHVYYPRGIPAGCVGQDYIGISHSHTHFGLTCSHSDPDASVLFYTRRALFSIVFCINGESELLYQDGRRIAHRIVQP